eukprot:Unigene11512_Nuclearia_a/m.35085 Unigene11512_Nuclearia_a/g.35085  ORF Unigene11512_Nuclearia_a/g.35085 Unigene11512_Nuclearia_a/m.35085 type:complete len:180 (+) Unigene11512_Nuclearia_a:180-719(+)
MGAWTDALRAWFPALPRITAIKTHSIVLRPRAPVSADALFLTFSSSEYGHQDPEVYPRASGDVYVCGISDDSPLPATTDDALPTPGAVAALRKMANALSHLLAEAPVTTEQACFLPYAGGDKQPLIGRLPGTSNAYIAAGHNVWGILQAPPTGLALAELICGGAAHAVDLSPFDPARYK